ncbi:MAG: helicase, partial [Alteromonadaceae bacterium]
VLSQSILDKSKHSVFTRLITDNTATSVMLTDTYRMNQELTRWPSQQYYQGQLVAAQGNAKRALKLLKRPPAREEILSKHQSFIYLQSPGFNARTVSKLEARWVAEIVNNAKRSGVSLEEIGVVTPFRAQARALKKALADSLGLFSAKSVICDTVERMQGQERELIIISLCATEVLFLQTLANFFFQQERLNVAITRARSKLILIGPSLPDNFTAGLREESDIANVNAYKSLIEAAHAGPKPSNHHSN